MSLARQFGFEVEPQLPAHTGTSFTNLAERLKSRAQAQVLTTRANVSSNSDPRPRRASDGSIHIVVYADTASVMNACKSALDNNDFQFAKLSDRKLLVLPYEPASPDQVVFELSVECAEDSACTSLVKLSVPATTGSPHNKPAVIWSSQMERLHSAIVHFVGK